MRARLLLAVILISAPLHAASAEDGAIVGMEEITDFTGFPLYPKIVEEVDGNTVLQPKFQYLDSVRVYRITYMSDGLRVKGFLTTPNDEGIYPCIIFNRGGTRDFGKLGVGVLGAFFAALSAHDYVVIGSQYRGNDGGEGLEEFGGSDINDVLNLISALAHIEQADTARIGMLGGSRGGMMTYMTLARTDRLRAAAVWSGLANAFRNIESRPMMEHRVFSQLIPDYWENREAELKKRSAVFWADRLCKTTPLLVLHGSADWRVPPKDALEMTTKLYESKHPFRFVFFEGGDHMLTEHFDEAIRLTINWFNDYLRDGKSLPNLEPHGR